MPRYIPHSSVRGIEAPIGEDDINNFNDKLTHIVLRSFSVFKSIKFKNKTIKDLEFLISCYPHTHLLRFATFVCDSLQDSVSSLIENPLFEWRHGMTALPDCTVGVIVYAGLIL